PLSTGIESMSACGGAKSTDSGPVPACSRAMSLDIGSMPVDGGAMSTDSGPVSACSESVSTDIGSMPACSGLLSIDIGSVPACSGEASTDIRSMPACGEAVSTALALQSLHAQKSPGNAPQALPGPARGHGTAQSWRADVVRARQEDVRDVCESSP